MPAFCSQSRTERCGNDPKGTHDPPDELTRLREGDEGGGGGGGQEGGDPRTIKFWPKAKIVLRSLAVTATANSDKPSGELGQPEESGNSAFQ